MNKWIAAVALGNALEFYDFLTFSFFAPQIGQTFFPTGDPSSSLLLTLATFGAGFLARPVGGIMVGRLSDQRGRRVGMLLSFGLMGLALVGMALTPSYASIGVAAPVLVIGWRLVQGFALGGDVGPSTAFLIEAAPALRRGLVGSMQSATQGLAIVAAGVVGFVLASLLTPAQMEHWGWRVALLIGAVVVPVGMLIRRHVPETRVGPDAPALSPGHRLQGVLAIAMAMLLAGTVQAYVLNTMTTYAVATLHLSPRVSFVTTVIRGLGTLAFAPVGGWISDRAGRRRVMLTANLLLVVTLPAYYAISHVGTPPVLFLVTGLIAMICGIAQGPLLPAIAESIPVGRRALALGGVYAVTISVFGGSTPFLVTWLQKVTGSPMVPGWYLCAGTLIGLVGILKLSETAPAVLARTGSRSDSRRSTAPAGDGSSGYVRSSAQSGRPPG